MENRPLIDYTTTIIPVECVDLKVRDLWRDGTGWDWTRIEPFVSQKTILRLAVMVVDSVIGARDRVAWGACPDGRFTVKSAFSLLT